MNPSILVNMEGFALCAFHKEFKMENKRILVFDGLNTFIRSYIVNPTISTHGQPIGGVVGFLGSLRKLIRETKPNEIVICWDGPGGSEKRKSIVEEYKAGRKPLRKNYKVEGMDEQSEKENMIWQQEILITLLNHMPIMQFMFEGVEADDVISYVVGLSQYKGWNKIIVSSDKDFIQLLDDETLLYRPVQKVILNKPRVIEEYNISPGNFTVARSIVGDKSDNLEGIRGAGLRTVYKRFPFLKENKTYTLEKIYDICQKDDSGLKLYKSILENRELVETNYEMMNLTPPSISPQFCKDIDFVVENFKWEMNVTGLKTISIKDGFAFYDWSHHVAMMRKIIADHK